MQKLELASPEWMAVLHALLVQYAREFSADVEFSVCEVLTAVPSHLDKHGTGKLAWHCIVKGSAVHFEETAIATADVRSEADYAFILPVARRIYSPQVMAEVEAYKARGATEGKIRATGKDASRIPPRLRELHNDLARLTL